MDAKLVLTKLQSKTPVIITGKVGAGKTRRAERIAAGLKKEGIKVGGVISPRVLEGGETIGYTIRDLETGQTRPFAKLTPPGVPVGRFFVSEEGLAFAHAAILRAIKSAQVVFIDEVGRLELEGKGLADAVRKALSGRALPVILIRTEFSERVRKAFGISLFDEIKAEKEEECA